MSFHLRKRIPFSDLNLEKTLKEVLRWHLSGWLIDFQLAQLVQLAQNRCWHPFLNKTSQEHRDYSPFLTGSNNSQKKAKNEIVWRESVLALAIGRNKYTAWNMDVFFPDEIAMYLLSSEIIEFIIVNILHRDKEAYANTSDDGSA